MNRVTSADGTSLAFDRIGQGPALILVVGAFNERSKGAPLAAFLAPHFSVISYDRRGRGQSDSARDYTPEREVEDLAALLEAVGGSACLFGYSSGAALALKAAASGLHVPKLVLYELPPAKSATHAAELASFIAAERRGDAVEYFQTQVVGIPEHVVAELRHAPFRPALEAMAHTLVCDAALVAYGSVTALATNVKQPTLALAGGASFPVMRQVASSLAEALVQGRSLTLEGQTHELVPAVLGPVLQQFLAK